MSQNLSSVAVVISALRVNSAYWVILHAFLSSADFFFKINFCKKFFQEYHQCQKFGSRSGQVEPDLGANCLQRSSADRKISH